jgi:hypothetical protein
MDVTVDFSDALRVLKSGQRARRRGWNGKGLWVVMQRPDEHSKMTAPYLYLEYPAASPDRPNGMRVPWTPSQTDMLASDWVVSQ